MKIRHQYLHAMFAIYGIALLLPLRLHATSTCHVENGVRTCCDAWVADTREGAGKGVVREKTIEALQRRIAESIRINRNWCNSVPTADACYYQVGSPRCDGASASTSDFYEDRQHFINSARLLVSEWEIRLEEAIAAQRGPNPYLGVGRVAKSYALALADAQEKLRAVKFLLDLIHDKAGGDVIRRLDAAKRQLEQSIAIVKSRRQAAEAEAMQEKKSASKRAEPTGMRKDAEVQQSGPGVSVTEFHGAEGSPTCPDLSYCLRVEDAVWDTRRTSDKEGAGTMAVTLINTCPSALRVLLSVPCWNRECKAYYALVAGEKAVHSLQATQNQWIAAASQHNSTERCLESLK